MEERHGETLLSIFDVMEVFVEIVVVNAQVVLMHRLAGCICWMRVWHHGRTDVMRWTPLVAVGDSSFGAAVLHGVVADHVRCGRRL